MSISAAQVKELREKTGVGMMECKKALQETEGDIEKAIVYLRERGMSRAAKTAGRTAAEGIVEVFVNPENNAGVLVELNCETDFVSKNDEFQKFAQDVAQLALKTKAKSVEELAGADLNGKTVADTLTALIAKIGENMNLRRVQVLTGDVVSGYTHMGGKIGALVAFEGGSADAAEVGKEVAMHIAAAAPRALNRDGVDKSELDQEQEIARKKLQEEKKPENLIDKIIMGQMSKFYKEICLLEQAFVKDPDSTVEKYVAANAGGAKVAAFSRFQLGEGIEKKKENFAEEVAAQLKN
jgi:elongation factor Ts